MSNTIGKKALVEDQFLKTEGSVIIYNIDSNGFKTGKGLRLGSCGAVAIGTTSTLQEYKETQSGLNQTVKTLNTDIQTTLELSLLNINAETLAFLVAGESQIQSATTGTTFAFDALGGDTVDLGAKLIDATTFVLKSGTTPSEITYEEGKNYEVDNSGVVYIYPAATQTTKGATNVISDTVAVEATATFNQIKLSVIKAGQLTQVEKYVVFSGYNVITGKYFKLECPKVSFSPSESLALLQAEVSESPISGRVLASAAYPEVSPYSIVIE